MNAWVKNKILIRSGVEPCKQYRLKDILDGSVNIGGNTGNLMFINAVAESLKTSEDVIVCCDGYRQKYTDEEIERINAEYDCFVLPMADAFREDQIRNLTNLTEMIRRFSIPCVVVGVGLRAPYEYDVHTDRIFDDTVKRFMTAVLEKSACVGIRGERTGAYLRRLGFRENEDYMVIGCPSMCMSAIGKGLTLSPLPTQPNEAKVCFITNDLAPKKINDLLVSCMKTNPQSTVIVQRTNEISDIYSGHLSRLTPSRSKRNPGKVYGRAFYKQLLRENRIHAFADISSWRNYVASQELCINERFHGTVASILAGVPSILIPFDSRTRELTDYHKLPTLDLVNRERGGGGVSSQVIFTACWIKWILKASGQSAKKI